jgi:hypothetical protein
MQLFPAGERGMRQVLRFAARHRCGDPPVVGLFGGRDGAATPSDELEAAFARHGFRVIRVDGQILPLLAARRGLTPDGARGALLAAREASRRLHARPGGGRDGRGNDATP